jgi:hypothetical protein
VKRIAGLSIAAALALGLASVAYAGTVSGTTTVLDEAGDPTTEAIAGVPTDIHVELSTTAPVVPYAYSLVNRCWHSGKTNGVADSYERFDLAGPWFDDDTNPLTSAMIVAVNLNPVPAGAKCKVVIYKRSTAVQGSDTIYSVVSPTPAP